MVNVGICLDLSNKDINEWVESVGLEETYRQLIEHNYNLPTLSEYQKLTNLPLLNVKQVRELYDSLFTTSSEQFKDLEELKNKTTDTQAAFWNNMFYFDKQIELRQAYEEAFHKIFQTLTTTDERNDLIKLGRELLKNRLKNQNLSYKKNLKQQENNLGLKGDVLEQYLIEEEIAKEYVNFATYGTMIADPIRENVQLFRIEVLDNLINSLLQFFRKLFNIQKGYRDNKEVLDSYFNRIQQGKFKDVQVVQENGYSIPSYSPLFIQKEDNVIVYSVVEQRKHYNTIVNIVRQLRDIQPYNEDGSVFTTDQMIEQAIDIFSGVYSSSTNENTQALIESLQPVENPDIMFDENAPEFENSLNYNRLVKDIQEQVERTKLTQLDEFEYNENEEDSSGGNFYENTSDNADKRDYYKSFPEMMKIYLSTIPVEVEKTVQRTFYTEKGNKVKNKIKVQHLVDPLKVFSSTVKITANQNNTLDRLKKMILFSQDSNNKEFNAFLDKFLFDVFLVDEELNNRSHLSNLKSHILSLSEEEQLQTEDGYRIQNITLYQTLNKAFNLFTRNYRMYFIDSQEKGVVVQMNPATTNSVSIQLSSWQIEWEKNKQNLYDKNKSIFKDDIGSQFAEKYNKIEDLDKKENLLDKHHTLLTRFFTSLGVTLSPNYIKYIIGDYIEKSGGYLPYSYRSIKDSQVLSQEEIFDIGNIGGLVEEIIKQNTNYKEDPSTMFDPFYEDRTTITNEGMLGRLKTAARGNVYFDENAVLSSFLDSDNKMRYGHQHETILLNFGVNILKDKNRYEDYKNSLGNFKSNPLIDFYDSLSVEERQMLSVFSSLGITKQPISETGTLQPSPFKRSTVNEIEPNLFIANNINIALKGYKAEKKMIPYHVSTLEASNTNSYFTGTWWGKREEYTFEDPQKGKVRKLSDNSIISEDGSLGEEGLSLIKPLVQQEYNRIKEVREFLLPYLEAKKPEVQVDANQNRYLEYNITEQDLRSVPGYNLKNIINGYHTGVIYLNEDMTLHHKTITDLKAVRGVVFSQSLKGVVNDELSYLYYENMKGVENEIQIDDMIRFNTAQLLDLQVKEINVDIVDIDKDFYIASPERGVRNTQNSLGLYTFEDSKVNLPLNLKIFYFNEMINKISFNRLLFGDFAIQNKNDLDDYSKRIKALESNIISTAYRIIDKSKGIDKPFTSVKSVMMVEAKSMKDDLSSVQVDKDGNPAAIDSDDAQSYSSVEHFRKLQWGLGRLTSRTTGILNKIQEGIPLTSQEKREIKGTEFFNIQKTRGYGKELDLKTSEFYLTKPFVSFKRRISQEEYDRNGIDYYRSVGVKKPEGISSFTIPKEGATKLVTKEQTSEGTSYYEWVDDGTRTYLYDKMMLLEGFRKIGDNWVYQGDKAKIDVISPISAHKRKKQNVWDGNVSTFVDSIHNQEFDIENDNLYGLQVENPSGKNEVIDPTQETEIILSEVSGDIEFFSFDGKSKGVLDKEQLYRAYESLQAKRVNNSWDIAIKEVVDEEGNPLYKYFWKAVQEGLQDTGGDLQSINFLNLLETNDGVETKYTPEYNANIPIVKNKVEQMIFSYFSKGVLKQKRAGESKAMFSPRGIGFLKKLETHVINGETIHTWTTIDRNSDEYRQGIILAQNNNFVRQGYTFNGLEQNPVLNTLIPLLEDMSDRDEIYFIDEARHLKPRVQSGRITGYYSEAMMPAYRPDMKSIQEGFKYMSGVRIPSQDKGTSANIEWIEMMDYVFGNSVSIAKEIQELAGSDFDIDKLFISYPEGYWEKDVFIPYEKIDNMSVMFDWYKQYLFNKPKSLFKRRLTEELKTNKVYNELKNEVTSVKPQLNVLWNYYNDLISDVYSSRQITLEDRNLLKDEIDYLKEETELLGQDYNDYRNLTDQFIEMGDKVSSLNKTLKNLRNEKTQLEERFAQLSIDLKSLRNLAEEKVLNDLNLPATVDEYSVDIYANTGLVNNELLQIKQASLVHNYKTYSRPTDVKKLKDLDGTTFDTFSREDFTENVNINPFTSLYQRNYRKKIQASKTGIASAVNANLAGLALGRLGVELNDSNVVRIKDKNGNVHTYDRFTETTTIPVGLSEQEVLSWMSSLITATTDETKEGVLAYFRLYGQGLDVFSTGLLYGIHPDILISIINNPIIQSAIERSQRDPLSTEKTDSLSSILSEYRIPITEEPLLDLSDMDTSQVVEVFSRILETAEQNADFVKFMRLKRGYDATYSDFTKVIQSGLKLGLDKVIPFYNTPLIQEFKETEHKAYNLPYYLEKRPYAIGNTFNYMSKIVPDTYNILGKFLIEGTTNYNMIYNHLTKVADIPAYKVEDFRKEVFVSILGRMLQASKQYNLDLNLIVDTGDNKTLGKRYLDIVEKYKDDVDISESPLFKKLLPNLAVTKRKQKEIAKEKKYIVDSDFTDTFSLKVFSKVDTDMQQDLMDEYFRLSKHPDEDIRSFLKDLFSYYILKDAMFFSPSGISKIFPNYLFKGISDSLDRFMESPIPRYEDNLRRIEQNILLDVRNQDFIKTIPAVIEVEKTNEKGDVVSNEVFTYYRKGGLLSLIRGNKTTHVEEELVKKGIISQDENGKFIYPEVISRDVDKKRQFYKKVNEGLLTVNYVLTPLFGTQNTYSNIAQKTIVGSSQNLEGIIQTLEEGKEEIRVIPKLPDDVKRSLIKIVDDQVRNLSTFRNQNTSEVVINEVTKDNLSMSVEEMSPVVVGEEISSYSDQNNTQTTSSLERIVTKYPKTVTMVEGGVVYQTSKLLEILSVFKDIDDGTIADRREFSEEILSEYGMTNSEYEYAKNNQGVLSSLLIEAENLNLGHNTFPDIVNYILNQNVEYIDTYQLNLFDQNNTYSEDEVNNKPC